MTKKLLLVDDEELFLKSLKEGLEPLSHIFETHICFSVNEAIKQVVTNKYDVVITDIRMPGKSGIDLLIYLKAIRYSGKVMVMSAYNTEESSDKIRSFGVVDLISKPFDFEWFKNKMVDIFTLEEKEKEKPVTFESLDLVTVMQIINMERKTSTLEITMKEGKGHIFFENGEIIHAQYGNLEGEKAVSKLISLNEGSIAVKDIQRNKIKRTMGLPFVEQIMNIMKTIDEKKRDQKKRSEHKPTKEKETRMPFGEKLSILKEVNGYLGAGVFTPQGEMLEGASDISGIKFEEAGALIHDTLKNSKAMSKEIGFGILDMIQLHTPAGIVFAKCCQERNLHFHTILVIKTDGNITMARLKLNQVVELLMEEF